MANIFDTHHDDFIHVVGDGRSGTGNNIEQATAGGDSIHIDSGGHDTVFAGGGIDTIFAGDKFSAADKIDGEAGTDTLNLAGNYKAGVVFNADTLVNVENIQCAAGFSYSLTLADATIAVIGGLTVDASSLLAGQNLNLDASADTDGFLTVNDGAGDDVVVGSSHQNVFFITHGGHDSVTGGALMDFITFGSLERHDFIDGAGGNDVVILNEDYSSRLFIDNTVLTNVEEIDVLGAHDYNLAFADNVVGAGTVFRLLGSGVGPANSITFDGSAESDATLQLVGGQGNDVLTGGSFSNAFTLNSGGNDTAFGGAGDDRFNFDTTFNVLDQIRGNGGDDLVSISAAGSQSLTLSHAMMDGIGTLQMTAGAFTIATLDNLLDPGETLFVLGQTSSSSNPLDFDGSAESNGRFDVSGTPGADTLRGGHGNDVLRGNGGKDTLTPGGGRDQVSYFQVSESTGANYDTVVGFDFRQTDKFDFFDFDVTHVNHKVRHGTLSTGSFDSDLSAAVTAAKLDVGNAVVFKPDHGTLAGLVFLIVNADTSAGYQAGSDFVIELVHSHHLDELDRSDFT